MRTSTTRRPPQRLVLSTGTLIVAVLTVAASIVVPVRGHHPSTGELVTGSVVDTTGHPVTDATVSTVDFDGDATFAASTDHAGRFQLAKDRPTYLRISARGMASRVIAAAPGYPVAAVLTHRSPDSVSIRMGGDVMFGRRFYQPNPYDRTLLTNAASVSQHSAILRPLRPLLTDGDITAVNLETALLPPDQLQRVFAEKDRAGLHPDKDFVLVSSTAAAEALANNGVDVVSLGNNHVYDALADGMASTITALDAAGIAHFGGGRTIDEAWRPAVVAANGQRVAFIGCTTVSGDQHQVKYVATEHQGGAALCETQRLEAAVRAAAQDADDVVVMIHGGTEYQRQQDPRVQDLTSAAIAAGAGTVVNHHPHVAGKVRMEGGAFVAESMGNLVFDQNLWDTLPSSMVRVDMRAGKPENGWLDPVASNGFVPRPVAGRLADEIARIALPDADSGSLRTLSPMPAPVQTVTERVPLTAGTPISLVGSWPTGNQPARVRAGHDLLLGTGSFDDAAVGESPRRPTLWTVGEHAELDDRTQCDTPADSGRGHSRGLVLNRGGLSTISAVASPVSRIPVPATARLILQLDIDSATPGATVDVAFYSSMDGGSFDHQTVQIPERAERSPGCRRLSVDITVPARTVAVQPFVKLDPPHSSTSVAYLFVDNIKLIQWLPWNPANRTADTITGDRGTSVPVDYAR